MKCPLCDSENIELFHDNVWDNDSTKVYKCEDCDLTFLWPQMSDSEEEEFYSNYGKHIKNRANNSELPGNIYENNKNKIKKRYSLISPYFINKDSVCEIGSATGNFLEILDNIELKCAVELNDTNRKYSKRFSDMQFNTINQVPDHFQFDIICMFHTFEHIKEPISFLNECNSHLNANGKIIIEIPYIKDPLISLYDNNQFKDFYFQMMHPYIYSKKSIKNVLNLSSFEVEEFIFYQRYGLDNHLSWLVNEEPGGDEKFNELFSNVISYKAKLEKNKTTDTFFIIASK